MAMANIHPGIEIAPGAVDSLRFLLSQALRSPRWPRRHPPWEWEWHTVVIRG
ncbi:hypothetical protein STSO111631_09280 [Stackebrandtia soli]